MIYTRASCRLCRSGRLDPLLDLGNLALSAFLQPTDPDPLKAPLDVCICGQCKLVQLHHTVDPTKLFVDHYWYRSGINETMKAELADIVAKAIRQVPERWHTSDVVIDIGANDGTLLSEYRAHPETREIPRVAFEPAHNLQRELAVHAELRFPQFFPPMPVTYQGRAKILTSIAMFYDLDEPAAAVAAIADMLHPEGVWIVQFQDLDQMMRATAYDNICHEHLCYYSLHTFCRLVEPHGLMVVDAEHRPINGGSLRLYVKHQTASHTLQGTHNVHRLLAQESAVEDWDALERFAWEVGVARRQLQTVLGEASTIGPIDVYGASTKFNTLAQYCGLTGTLIRQAWERSPEKYGRYTVTGIPIVSEADGRADPPAVLLAGIWQFRESLLQREAEYLQAGGTILFPLPEVELVRKSVRRGD